MGIEKVVCVNRKAWHDYYIEDTYEAGIVLKGTEVKSLRMGRANLKDSFAKVEENAVYLHNFHISQYSFSHHINHDPERVRKLLLHKREIKRLLGKVKEKGLTLVPLKVYFKDSRAKIELALVKGKKLYDKREDMKKKTAVREMEKAFKEKLVR